MLVSDKEHFDLFRKPKLSDTTTPLGSENSRLYKKFIPTKRDIDPVVEYFKFSERVKRGFSSPYLKINPYENAFYTYVQELEEKYEQLPETVAHARLMADIEEKHKIALASFL